MNNNIIECRGVVKDYKNVRALDYLNFTVPDKGAVVGLLGTNGSGKTTLIKLLAGLLTPTSGDLRVCGMPIGTTTKSLIAYLPDSNFLCESFTVAQEVEYYKDFFEDFDEQKALSMIQALHLPLDRKVRALSKGNKEKLGLILTLARNAKIYIFDEPIAGVDPAAREYIMNAILSRKKEDATMIISTHLIADIEPALDYVIFLKDGKAVVEGEANLLRAKENKSIDELFREVFRW